MFYGLLRTFPIIFCGSCILNVGLLALVTCQVCCSLGSCFQDLISCFPWLPVDLSFLARVLALVTCQVCWLFFLWAFQNLVLWIFGCQWPGAGPGDMSGVMCTAAMFPSVGSFQHFPVQLLSFFCTCRKFFAPACCISLEMVPMVRPE